MRTWIATLAALALPASAHAFCGTYVGQPGAELYANTSQVLMVRQGDRTTLTLTNDYQGDLTEFAMVIPVPQVLEEGDVRLADASLIDRFAEYSGPRLVSYTCEDFLWEDEWEGGGGRGGCFGFATDDGALDDTDADFASGSPPALDVTVESTFTVGAYEIVILSSEDSGDLVTWLQLEGYGVSEDAEAMLGEYIEAGSYFFAAKVSLDEAPPPGAFLPPLQVSYTSESFSLPIKLGTLNSPGSQDLVLYLITDGEEGRVGVANYPEVRIEDECMARDVTAENVGDHILDEFGGAVDEVGGAGWIFEYGWSPSGCDPCPPGGAVEQADLGRAGFRGEVWDAYVSRIRVRYPATAENDLVLYTTGDDWSTDQLRYIVYDEKLEQHFGVCGEDVRGDGTCDGADGERRRGALGLPWLPVGFLGLVGLVGWLGRRRR